MSQATCIAFKGPSGLRSPSTPPSLQKNSRRRDGWIYAGPTCFQEYVLSIQQKNSKKCVIYLHQKLGYNAPILKGQIPQVWIEVLPPLSLYHLWTWSVDCQWNLYYRESQDGITSQKTSTGKNSSSDLSRPVECILLRYRCHWIKPWIKPLRCQILFFCNHQSKCPHRILTRWSMNCE